VGDVPLALLEEAQEWYFPTPDRAPVLGVVVRGNADGRDSLPVSVVQSVALKNMLSRGLMAMWRLDAMITAQT
jgi:hypothetical protein